MLLIASINFEQAASLVIGAAIGTTVTGALAAIGASVSTKRTALAHVLFNLSTGLIAVGLLPLFLLGIQWAQKWLGLEPGAVSLAAFHTFFIAVGVAIFLPLAHRFSRWIERMLPEKETTANRHLDSTLLNVPAVALEATRRALSETATEMFRLIGARLGGQQPYSLGFQGGELRQALDRTQKFFAKIPPLGEGEPLSQTRVAQMHAIDHLVRLGSYLDPPLALRRVSAQEDLQENLTRGREILDLGGAGLAGGASQDWLERVAKGAADLSELHQRGRAAILWKTAAGGRESAMALDLLEALRWLNRLGRHVWRICNYLGGNGRPEPALGKQEERPEGGDQGIGGGKRARSYSHA